MLYLIAGLYSTGHYNNLSDEYLSTNVTINQLSQITAEKPSYIKESLFVAIRKSSTNTIRWKGNYYTHKDGCTCAVRRNLFTLSKPKSNFRIIKRAIFHDERFSPEEKGYIIALYLLCVNNTFRFDLSDAQVATKLGVSLNTWKKYKQILMCKGVLQEFKDAPAGLLDPNFENALVLNYDYLGYQSPSAIHQNMMQDTDFISLITEMQNTIRGEELYESVIFHPNVTNIKECRIYNR